MYSIDMRHPLSRMLVVPVIAISAVLVSARPALGYAVFGHQGMVDAVWDTEIVPLMRDRFPGLTPAQLRQARAYAYGGAVIQDLGYYPFGSHLFTNLTHYVRSGDFVEALIRTATTPDELGFALGALAHSACDNAGHPLAVNRVVPLMYPKVRAKVGSEALYVDSPARHVMVEFAFDVLQVARGAYVGQAYRDRIGFEVSNPLLERGVRETYAMELADLLLNVDLAIGTYRHAVGTTIPELTRIAWRDKRDEIETRMPGVTQQSFVYVLSRRDYQREFGSKYRKPGLLARVLAFVLKILPKVGPMRPLAFEPLTADAERLFLDSLTSARTRYRTALQALRKGRIEVGNTDFETGDRPVPGANRLADETYAALLHELAERKFRGVPTLLREHLDQFFAGATQPNASWSPKERARIRRELAAMPRP